MGFLFLLIGAAVLGFALIQHFKGKRILSAPFKKTGELLKNPTSSDPKGLMSTEGAVLIAQPLLSPCSKTPCLYYEVEIVREWEKQEQTQDGVKTKSGSSSASSLKQGMIFSLDDGTGAVKVDAQQGGDFDNLKKNWDKKVSVGSFVPGELQFGELRMQTPSLPSGERTVAFKAVEKIVPVGGNLFALGKLENGQLTKPGWRSMMFSSKGREGLLASTAKKKKFGFIGGAVATVAAIPAFIFAPAGSGGGDRCSSQITGIQAECKDNVGSENTYSWTVDEATTYHVEVVPPSGKKFPFIPEVQVTDATGQVVGEAVGGIGQPTKVSFAAEPGTYEIRVKPADGAVSGGYDYTFSINGNAVKGAAVAKADAPAAQPNNPSVCADEDTLVGARTCQATMASEDGSVFTFEAPEDGNYTIKVLPQGAKSLKHPMLVLSDESGNDPISKDGSGGTLSHAQFFKKGSYMMVINDLEVEQDDFPIKYALSITGAPAPAGKKVAAAPPKGKVVRASGKVSSKKAKAKLTEGVDP